MRLVGVEKLNTACSDHGMRVAELGSEVACEGRTHVRAELEPLGDWVSGGQQGKLCFRDRGLSAGSWAPPGGPDPATTAAAAAVPTMLA